MNDRTRLADMYPGLANLPGSPTWDVVGGPVMRHLDNAGEVSWRRLGDMTERELLLVPGLGPTRLAKIRDALAERCGASGSATAAARVPVHGHAEHAHLISALTEIAAWGAANGCTSLLDAVADAAASGDAHRPEGALALLASISPRDLAGDDAVRRYDPVALAEDLLGSLDQRQGDILDRILDLDDDKPTLQELGERHGVTREAIRLGQVKVEERIDLVRTSPDFRPLAAAGERLRERLGTAIPLDAVRSDFAKFPPDHVDALILHLAGPYRITDEWVIADDVHPLESSVVSTFEALADHGLAPLDAVTDALGELGIHEQHRRRALGITTRLRIVDDHVVDWRGSLGGKAALVLRLRGEPMTPEELAVVIEPDSVRGMTNQVQASSEIARVGVKRYGLVEWDMNTFEGVAPTMVARLRERGAVDLEALAVEIADEYGASRNSVKILAGTHPAFIVEGADVRLRRDDEPYVVDAKLSETARCYRIGETWAYRFRVDHDVLRGSGRGLPEAMAAHLGIVPLTKTKMSTPFGDLSFGWKQNPYMGSTRAAAHALGAEEGDRLFLVARTASSVDFRILHEHDMADDPDARIRQLVGAPQDGELVDVLADALDLPGVGGHTVEEIRARLVSRKEDELVQLLDEATASQTQAADMTGTYENPQEDPKWIPLFAALAEIAQPLFDSGWTLTATGREESWEFGDSVFYDLQRGKDTVELEYYVDGRLVAYPVDPDKDEDDDEPTEPFFSVDDGAGQAAAHFARHGWV